jgi:protein-S-isoprenylcysteine O-methyltransferase Ste14
MELVFRLIFVVAWLAFLAGLAWVRFRASPQLAPKPARFNRKRAVALALFGPPWFAGIILYAIDPSAIAFLSAPLPMWLRGAMVVVIVPSIPFVIWSHRTLGKNWVHALDAETFLQRNDQALVTDGPYRYVRNPIYLGSFVFIVALGVLAANWLLLVPALFLVALIHRQIANEEAMLLERFGAAYREYCKRTPRLVPGIKRRS